jgi:hypothetical protein
MERKMNAKRKASSLWAIAGIFVALICFSAGMDFIVKACTPTPTQTTVVPTETTVVPTNTPTQTQTPTPTKTPTQTTTPTQTKTPTQTTTPTQTKTAKPPVFQPTQICYGCINPPNVKIFTWGEMLPTDQKVSDLYTLTDKFCIPFDSKIAGWDCTLVKLNQVHVRAWTQPFSIIVGDKYIPAELYGKLWILPNSPDTDNGILIKGTYTGKFDWKDWPTLTRIRSGGVTVQKYFVCTHPSTEWDQVAGDWHLYWKPVYWFQTHP